MMKNVHVKLNQDSYNKSGTQQEGDILHRVIELKFKEDFREMLHFEHSSVR